MYRYQCFAMSLYSGLYNIGRDCFEVLRINITDLFCLCTLVCTKLGEILDVIEGFSISSSDA